MTWKLIKLFVNKKVLLRERKRHTDRGISSTRLPPPQQGYSLGRSDRVYLRWGTPHQGYPRARSDRGCIWGTHWTWLGYPPVGPGWGIPISDLAGYPPSDLAGVPSPIRPGWGTTPRCGQTENITFPHTTYAVSRNRFIPKCNEMLKVYVQHRHCYPY